MDLLNLVLDLAELAELPSVIEGGSPPPDKVTGRVAHIDGDFLAYIVSADRKDEDPTTVPQAIQHLEEFISQIMLYSGSDDYMLYITQGDKGGRAEQARLKRYQENREDKKRPLILGDVRRHMAMDFQCTVCEDAEADDYLAWALYQGRQRGEENLNVLVSQDKDLRMVPGMHYNWMSEGLTTVDNLGSLELHEYETESGNKVKKLRGTGGLWFFAQLLMGDAADNISGLPYVTGNILNMVKPTQATTKAWATLDDPKATEKQKAKAQSVLDSRKPGRCGQMFVWEYLKDCKSLKEAYSLVINAYAAYHLLIGFKDYNDEPISVSEAFDSECRLLYMRHNLGSEDFREYLDGIVSGEIA